MSTVEINLFSCCCCLTSKAPPGFLYFPVYSIVSLLLCFFFRGYSTDRLKRKNLRDKFSKSTRLWGIWQSYTGCPKLSQKFAPLLYESVIQYYWTRYPNHLNKSFVFQSNSLFSYLLCLLLTEIFDLCTSAPKVREREYIFLPHIFSIL